MAHGDPIDTYTVGQGVFASSWKLLDTVAATTDGVWVDVRGFVRFSVDVVIEGTATVQIHGSNAPTKPADNVDGRQIGSNVTASAVVDVNTPLRWIKAKVSAHTSGAVTANIVATAH